MRSPPKEEERRKEDRETRLTLPGGTVNEPTAAACSNCPFRGYCLPRGLEWLHIGNRKRLVTIPRVAHRGEVLYRAGQHQQPLYIIKAGSVKVSIASAEGEDQVVWFHLAGDLVGADGLEGRTSVSTAVALETTGLCELPPHELSALSQRFATVQHRLIRHLSGQLSHAQTMLLVLGKRSADERVASFLVDLMGRLEARGLSSQEFNLSMTRCDIASYLGLAVETVSRAFRRLQKGGLLSVYGRRVGCKDIGALRVLAGMPPELSKSQILPSDQKSIA